MSNTSHTPRVKLVLFFGYGLIKLEQQKGDLCMALPIDLVVVRHGKSEGNAAKRLYEAGAEFPDINTGRHTAQFRLTDQGREQAIKAGEYLRQVLLPSLGGNFDRFLVSPYNRAKETAALLGLPDAKWFVDNYLHERDWGELESCSQADREAKFAEILARQDIEPLWWRPTGGQSLHEKCLQVDRTLDTLHRECSDRRVVMVCHGEVMWCLRIRLERLSQERFLELHHSKRSEDRIHNSEIFHYSRMNPETRQIAPYLGWLRRIRPAEGVTDWGWQPIVRESFTNEDLLAQVGKYERILSWS